MSRVLLYVIFLATSACGYTFAASGSNLPADAHTIYVAHFANHSLYTGLDAQLIRYIKDEIANHKRLKLVDDPSKADLTLEGVIQLVNAVPQGYNAVYEPTTYSYSISANADLVDNRTNKVIWTGQHLMANMNYGVVPQAVAATSPQFLLQNLRAPQLNQLSNQQIQVAEMRAARQETMQTLAQQIYSSMSQGF